MWFQVCARKCVQVAPNKTDRPAEPLCCQDHAVSYTTRTEQHLMLGEVFHSCVALGLQPPHAFRGSRGLVMRGHDTVSCSLASPVGKDAANVLAGCEYNNRRHHFIPYLL